jgi:erythromycin esterase
MSKHVCGSSYFCIISLTSLVFVFVCSWLLVAAPQVHAATRATDPVISWISQHADPLRTTQPGGSDADLQPLQQVVGNASIVGLGEATHGTHEFFTLKTRILEYLVTRMGFNTFVMENNWGMSRVIDNYITTGQGNIWSALLHGTFQSWRNQEFRDLIEWLRAYNADPSHTTKVHFMGMDCQGVDRDDLDQVENYINRVDPRQADHVQALYKDLAAAVIDDSSPSTFPYYRLSLSTKQQYSDQAQQVYTLLTTNQRLYEQKSSEQDFNLALQNARVIVQGMTFLNWDTQQESFQRFVQRDAFMAENVAWIYQHAAGSHPKMIVWAHDAHIANNPSYGGTKNMGGFLHDRFGPQYLTIGTSLYQGSVTAYFYPDFKINTIKTTDTDSYNYTLGQVAYPIYMIDLRNTPAGPVTQWANGPHSFLFYGLGGEDLSNSISLKQQFNVIVQVQNTTPAQSQISEVSFWGTVYDNFVILIVILLIVVTAIGGMVWLIIIRKRKRQREQLAIGPSGTAGG